MKTVALALLAACSNNYTPAESPQVLSKVLWATQNLANQGYVMWSGSHPGKACPASLDELDQSPKALVDPWGNAYKMVCGKALPAGVRFGVVSFGPDGKEDTADDIHSWDDPK